MTKYVLSIEGMMCAHCEAHMVDAVNNSFTVKKVEASSKDNKCVIIADELDESKLEGVVAQAGYKLLGVEKSPYEKKGLFSKFKK